MTAIANWILDAPVPASELGTRDLHVRSATPPTTPGSTRGVGVVPRTIPGNISPLNRRAIEWGYQGWIVYGCQNVVVVVDPITTQVLQVLDRHKAPVTTLLLEHSYRRHSVSEGMVQRLISGDASGTIYVWNITQGVPIFECPSGTKAAKTGHGITSLAWLSKEDGASQCFLSLLQPNSIYMWNAGTGQKLWKHDFVDRIFSFSLDPFDSTHLAIVAQESFVFIDDLSEKAPPSSNGKRICLAPSDDANQVKTKEQIIATLEDIVISHSPHERGILYLLYSKEIISLDLSADQTLSSVYLERNAAVFKQMQASTRSNTLFFLHENGGLSVRVRGAAMRSNFETAGQMEALRAVKNAKIQSLCLNPVDECHVAGMTNDGRLIVFRCEPIAPPVFTIKNSMQFVLETVGDNSVYMPTCMRMSAGEPDKALLAVGTTAGVIQLFDVRTGVLRKQFSSHVTAIKGIDWSGTTQLLSYTTDDSTPGCYRSIVCITDTVSNRITIVRDKSNDSSPISAIRASLLQQYFVVVFRDKPLELWDMQKHVLLKTMPSSFPIVTALDWSLNGFKRPNPAPTQLHVGDLASPLSSANLDRTSIGLGLPDLEAKVVFVKEHFVVTTQDGHLSHFTVEGSVVKNGARVPAEVAISGVSCIAWKDDFVVFGDAGGNIHVWDIGTRSARAISTQFVGAKEILFAPVKNANRFLVLFQDGFGVWDATTGQLRRREAKPKETVPLTLIAWASGENPVVATADGQVRIYDSGLQYCTSPLEAYQFSRPLRSPFALDPRSSQYLRVVMQHQAWKQDFSLDLTSQNEIQEKSADMDTRVWGYVELIPASLRHKITKSSSVDERSFLTSAYFGDEFELEFWTVVKEYVAAFSANPESSSALRRAVASPESRGEPVAGLVDMRKAPKMEGDDSNFDRRDYTSMHAKVRLPHSYDLLQDAETIRKADIERLELHNPKYLTPKQVRDEIDQQVLLGRHTKAVQLMLETDAKSEFFYVDALRACLVSALTAPGSCFNTIKLVAMSLIANNRLFEAVELLVLIDNGLDACRYLQMYGHWERATRLAKSILNPYEASEVILRWVDHLCSPAVNKKHTAVLVLVSIGHMRRALILLHAMGNVDLAARFVESCLASGALITDGTTSSHGEYVDQDTLNSVFLSYARYLAELGAAVPAKWYCDKANQPYRRLMERA